MRTPRRPQVSPIFAEWLVGMPAGWTSTRPCHLPAPRDAATERMTCLSLFTGCGGLDPGRPSMYRHSRARRF
eukprot:15011855-Alexandrium_andersonii.AAC.1